MHRTRLRTRLPRASLLRLGGAIGVLLMGSVRCTVATDPEPLQRFERCEDLQLYLEDQILHPGVEQSFQSGGVVACASNAPLADVGKGASEGEGETRVFTTTNTQEANVDEPDFVKNNGDVIFVLRRGQMIITQAWPADQMQVLSTTPMAGAFNMIFFEDPNNASVKRALVMAHFFSDKTQTLVKMFDVSDYTAPVELRTTLIDGDFVDARGVNGQVMLVTRAQLNLNVNLNPAPFSDDENRALLRTAGLGRILPEVSDFIVGQDTQPRVDRAVACGNAYAPSRSDGRSILLIHGFDLVHETAPLQSTAVVAGFSSVYASEKSLYLAATELSDGGYFTNSFATTRLHKLDAFSDDGSLKPVLQYKATGVFIGSIKDELSLDEGPDGSLRMVITDDSQSADTTQQVTSLVVLQEDGTNLKEVARVDDLGRGETVESVRFLGERAYVVTYPVGSPFFFNNDGVPTIPFEDPLTIIDLSDPRNPRTRGAVEVDGYSAYIHPVDDGHILTVGVNTDRQTGAMTALSLMLFDVTDADHPALLFRHDLGDGASSSEALVDRHAFTYFPEQKTFAIPVQHFDFNSGLMDSSNLAVFHVDIDAGITPLGTIEQVFFFTGLDGVARSDAPCAGVKRSVMIAEGDEAYVYAVSTAGITAATLADTLPTAGLVQLIAAGDGTCDASGLPL